VVLNVELEDANKETVKGSFEGNVPGGAEVNHLLNFSSSPGQNSNHGPACIILFGNAND
jgi:hypothetical protein